MRTTLNIEDSLIEKASAMTGIKEKTTLVKLRFGGAHFQRERKEACTAWGNGKAVGTDTEERRVVENGSW